MVTSSARKVRDVIYLFFIILFIYFLFWLYWIFVAASGLSPVVASADESLLRGMSFSLQ